MPINQQMYDDHSVFTIEGRLDARLIQQQREQLENITANIDRPVVFDMSQIDYLDSSGIGFLVYVFKRIAPSQHAMAITGLKDQPRKTIRMLQIDRMIPCMDTVECFRKNPPRLPRGHRRAKLKAMVGRLARPVSRKAGN